MSEHTPGPWHPYAESSREWCIDAEDEGIACTETEANARLIAAAPELLEAAKGVINILYSTDTNLSGEQERAVERLLWAQTKAEGKA